MPISPEQIAANIEASRLRRAAKAVARAIPKLHKFEAYRSKLVGFVVKTRHDKYKPFIGRVIVMDEDPTDALVHVVGEQPSQDTLQEALAFYEPERDKLAIVMETPVPSGRILGHWLAHMLSFQQIS
jgi:hypothetical protein